MIIHRSEMTRSVRVFTPLNETISGGVEQVTLCFSRLVTGLNSE
ncbi:hypothetical protein [Vibrio aerogenes]|nr:hypothetical protein [Vibrio aerogenes]